MTGLSSNAAIQTGADALNDLLEERTGKVFSLPFFVRLSHGLTTEQWRLYAKQFHVTCVSFDRLLNAAVENARKTGHTDLIAELEENLADEMGEGTLKGIPHATLRRNFFQAIGLPESEMEKTYGQVPVLPKTQEHAARIDNIIHDGSIYVQLGAFLAQEFLASGPGFVSLASGVAKSFPELADHDSAPMQYVYDHITDDAAKHFPHLLQVVAPLMADPAVKKDIFSGAEAMLAIEHDLYATFEQDILDSPSTKESAHKPCPSPSTYSL